MKIIKNYTFLKFIENINKEENYIYKINNFIDSKKIREFLNKNEVNNLYIYLKNKNYIQDFINTNVKFVFDENLINHKDIHFLYFIGKNINLIINDDRKKYTSNPIINSIFCDNDNFIIETENSEKYNHIINIDISNIISYTNQDFNKDNILNIVLNVWGYFSSYYIFNLPNNLKNEDIRELYDYISSKLGNIVKCRPVNDNSEKISYSRDVKYVANSNHFFSSNKYQPLHSDFAYFTYDSAPDYLTLYCLEKSEYGGITSLLSTKTLKNILEKYNKQLLEKINIDFTYKSQVDENNNFSIHNKKCFDIKTNYINWNYFQIKEEYNSEEKMMIRQEFFTFLNDIIYEGRMMDIDIHWKRGDCILFNDHLNLHTRSAFLGNRWLSGNAFFKKQNIIH